MSWKSTEKGFIMHARIMTKTPIKIPYKAISEANQIMINQGISIKPYKVMLK